MNDSTATLAIWNAKQVEWIAVKIMNWHNVQARGHDESSRIWAAAVDRDQNHYWDFVAEIEWNPIRDWNDWRQVEEKIMEDEKLWVRFIQEIWVIKPEKVPNTTMTNHPYDMLAIATLMQATLPARCTALYLAHTSLIPTL